MGDILNNNTTNTTNFTFFFHKLLRSQIIINATSLLLEPPLISFLLYTDHNLYVNNCEKYYEIYYIFKLIVFRIILNKSHVSFGFI
jgi:hypothetical protein